MNLALPKQNKKKISPFFKQGCGSTGSGSPESEGPGSLIGLVRQLSSIQEEQRVKQNAIYLGGCDRRRDPEAFSVEWHLFRNDAEIRALEKNVNTSYKSSCSQVYIDIIKLYDIIL